MPHLREDFSLYDFTSTEVARELCLIDWSLFKEVDPTECCHRHFLEARTGGYFFRAVERCKNVAAWVQYEVRALSGLRRLLALYWCCYYALYLVNSRIVATHSLSFAGTAPDPRGGSCGAADLLVRSRRGKSKWQQVTCLL